MTSKKADTTTSTKLRAYFNRNGLSEKNVLLEKIGKDQIVHPLNVHIKNVPRVDQEEDFLLWLRPYFGIYFHVFLLQSFESKWHILQQVG